MYFLQRLLFGLALWTARRVPIPCALAIAMAFHIVQLCMTLILIGGRGRLDSGVRADFVEPVAIVLVPVHLLLGGASFLIIRKTLENRRVRSTGIATVLR
ncbi:hypothetical protein [Paeniglutamicibacter antarcticus]|uniref:Uncharacterized protein n=1 Tax=Paeniglutamicibacter antarcticus TaxID=494023 RepID=A0ABP9TL78_9MICC